MNTCEKLFDFSKSLLGKLLSAHTYPFEALPFLPDYIRAVISRLPLDRFEEYGHEVWVAKTATVHPSAVLIGPCVVDETAEIRIGAFIRGAVMVGKGAVVGNSTEIKNSVLFDGVQVPHYNYVGDSILGYRAHMGAGAITSNVKGDKSLVVIHGKTDIPTELKKCGAFLGDYAEIGCNSVLNPGTVIGRHTQVYPLSCVRGTIPSHHIYKSETNITKRG